MIGFIFGVIVSICYFFISNNLLIFSDSVEFILLCFIFPILIFLILPIAILDKIGISRDLIIHIDKTSISGIQFTFISYLFLIFFYSLLFGLIYLSLSKRKTS